MKCVLVTGARGFLGAHCLPLLLERGYEVHPVSSQRVATTNAVRWHQADLLQSREAHRVSSEVRPSHLLHLAWETTPAKYWTSPTNVQWLEASLELLRAFYETGGNRVVSAGTCAEYDWQYGFCREHITPLQPRSLYGICEVALSQVIESWAVEVGLSAAWARVFFLYGPGSHPSRFPGPVISALLRGLPTECSHGRQVRDYLYVTDAAQALTSLLDSDARGPVNVGSGQPLAIREMVEGITKQTGDREHVRWGACRPPPTIRRSSRRTQRGCETKSGGNP
ncbi:MAG: NAD-dependent epimerase/dehydratase family protein [Candidatus Paceibacterota bacterium]